MYVFHKAPKFANVSVSSGGPEAVATELGEPSFPQLGAHALGRGRMFKVMWCSGRVGASGATHPEQSNVAPNALFQASLGFEGSMMGLAPWVFVQTCIPNTT